MTLDPKDISIAAFHQYMLSSVVPRPIALVSSIDNAGNVNLSPFSNFNFFGANPPTMVFSPSRRVRDNTTKHTLENVLERPEVVIHIVNYPMVQQMSLSSTEYGKGINEFIKSGLTEIASERVAPPRVKEAPVAFECKVTQIVPLGGEAGSGNLVICEVLLMHMEGGILDADNKIDPFKLDAVARMGGDFYVRTQGEQLFEIEKPVRSLGIGFDQLPSRIFEMGFSKNQLAQLANIEQIPQRKPAEMVFNSDSELVDACSIELARNNVAGAWQLLLNAWN